MVLNLVQKNHPIPNYHPISQFDLFDNRHILTKFGASYFKTKNEDFNLKFHALICNIIVFYCD